MATAHVVTNDSIELFSPVEAQKFDLMARGLSGLQQQVEGLIVESQQDANTVQRVLAEAKRALKTCDDTRLAQTKSLRDQVAAINDTWSRLTTALQSVAHVADRKIRGWNEQERQRQWREQEAARKAAAEAAEKAEQARRAAEAARSASAKAEAEKAEREAARRLEEARAAEDAIEQAPRGIKTDSGTTSSTWKWTFKVVNPDLVPRRFLTVDEKAIRAAVQAGEIQIEGVEVWQEEVLRTTTR